MSASGPIFDSYVMVDWSAASVPTTGADSIWIAVRDASGVEHSFNPPTRAQAVAQLADLLSDLTARGLHVLLGFDFALGLPAGVQARLNLKSWRDLWRFLRQGIQDFDDNRNSRFALAGQMNCRISGGTGPFWGCPAAQAGPNLSPKKGDFFGLPERRLCESRLPATKPVWQLSYAGAVGGQSLTGMARLEELRSHPWLTQAMRVWPFETGLRKLAKSSDFQIVVAEIYPSMFDAAVAPGQVKDCAQVLAAARRFAQLDDSGDLSDMFAGDSALSDQDCFIVETEEGWILGATQTKPADIDDWIKDPAEIYKNSFAAIQAEADLQRFPEDLRKAAIRIIHACGMTDIADDLMFSAGAGAAGTAALAAGAPILVDAEMVSHGIIRRNLPRGNAVICTLNDPAVPGAAKAMQTTRSAMAVDLWLPRLDGAVIAIGNAPTALFRLLQLIRDGAAKPALILGFPVGFVGAAESKHALIQSGLPFIALRGRRGGSAMAAACVNALAAGLS